MFGFEDGELILLAHAAEYCPRRVHYHTLRNWTRRGVRGVVLDSVWVGGREYTTRIALVRFFNALARPRRAIVSPTEARVINRSRIVREQIRAEFGV